MTTMTDSPRRLPLTKEERERLFLSLGLVETMPPGREHTTVPCDVLRLWLRWSREMESTLQAVEAENDLLKTDSTALQRANTNQACKVMAAALAGLAAKVDAPRFEPISVDDAPARFERWVLDVLRCVNAKLESSSVNPSHPQK